MKKRPAGIFLEDILQAIEKIEKYTNSLNYEHFRSDEKSVDAVIRNLEIIGEASKNISSELKDKFPQIPWKKMTGLRNIVAHEYFGIDLKIVWEIASKNLPEVKPLIKKIIGTHGHNPWNSKQLLEIRERMVPKAKAKGIFTEEDVTKRLQNNVKKRDCHVAKKRFSQ